VRKWRPQWLRRGACWFARVAAACAGTLLIIWAPNVAAAARAGLWTTVAEIRIPPVRRGDEMRIRIPVRNIRPYPLGVVGYRGCACTVGDAGGAPVGPLQRATVAVSIPTSGLPTGPVRRAVTIETRPPQAEPLRIRVLTVILAPGRPVQRQAHTERRIAP